MARLPNGKQKIAFGCYYTMKPKGLAVDMALTIKWYTWPFLMWNAAHKDYFWKWYQYPMVVWIICKLTVLKWMRFNG